MDLELILECLNDALSGLHRLLFCLRCVETDTVTQTLNDIAADLHEYLRRRIHVELDSCSSFNSRSHSLCSSHSRCSAGLNTSSHTLSSILTSRLETSTSATDSGNTSLEGAVERRLDALLTGVDTCLHGLSKLRASRVHLRSMGLDLRGNILDKVSASLSDTSCVIRQTRLDLIDEIRNCCRSLRTGILKSLNKLLNRVRSELTELITEGLETREVSRSQLTCQIGEFVDLLNCSVDRGPVNATEARGHVLHLRTKLTKVRSELSQRGIHSAAFRSTTKSCLKFSDLLHRCDGLVDGSYVEVLAERDREFTHSLTECFDFRCKLGEVDRLAATVSGFVLVKDSLELTNLTHSGDGLFDASGVEVGADSGIERAHSLTKSSNTLSERRHVNRRKSLVKSFLVLGVQCRLKFSELLSCIDDVIEHTRIDNLTSTAHTSELDNTKCLQGWHETFCETLHLFSKDRRISCGTTTYLFEPCVHWFHGLLNTRQLRDSFNDLVDETCIQRFRDHLLIATAKDSERLEGRHDSISEIFDLFSEAFKGVITAEKLFECCLSFRDVLSKRSEL